MIRLWYLLRNVYANIPSWIKSAGWFKRALGVLALIVVIALIAIGLSSLKVSTPRWFWEILGLLVLGVLVVLVFFRGLPWLDRRRFLRKQRGDLAPADAAEEIEPRKALEAAIREAEKRILNTPKSGGHSQLYRVPWFLVVGDARSEQDGLLRGSIEHSPFPPPTKSTGDEPWFWWFYKTLIVIETNPRFVCDNNDRAARGTWYRALQLLYRHRPKLPLNGIVVAVAAESLTAPTDDIRSLSLKLRRLVDEAAEQLQVELPIYTVVTGLDRLAGFDHLIKFFPKGVSEQAVGERLDWDAAGAWQQIDRIFQSLKLRWHTIRLAALKAEADPIKRRGIFEFVESFNRLQPGLEVLIKALLEDNPFQRNPRWRGVYFCATGSSKAFSGDLFTRFLPSDQPLAKRHEQWSMTRWMRTLIGAACVALLAWALWNFIQSASRQDVALLSGARTACPDSLASPQAPLKQLLVCEANLTRLEAETQSGPLSFGLSNHRKEIQHKQEALLEAFSTQVLFPFDAALSQDVHQGRIGLEHYLAVTQRLTLLEACGNDRDQCYADKLRGDYVFDHLSPMFRAIPAAADVDSKSLLSAYLTYLRRQPKKALDAESARLKALLAQLGHTRPLGSSDIAIWAERRFPGVTLERFWRPPATNERAQANDRSTIEVASAFTRQVFEQVLTPFVLALREALPSQRPAADALYQQYLDAYFKAWGKFLAGFDQGSSLWNGHYEGLIEKAAAGQSPYRQLWPVLAENVFQLPVKRSGTARFTRYWEDLKINWTDFFSVTSGHFRDWRASLNRTEIQPPEWSLAIEEKLRADGAEMERIFNSIIGRIAGKGKEEAGYEVARDIFATKGKGASDTGQDFGKLVALMEKPAEQYALQDQAGIDAWGALQGPARLALRLLTHRAGQHIQALWETDVIDALGKLPKRDRGTLLLGENGRINGFISDHLKAFVTEKDRQPIALMGVSLPFTANYQSLRDQQTLLSPVTDPNKPIYVGTFRFTQPSSFGRIPEGRYGSEFILNCRGSRFSLSNKAELASEQVGKVYWTPKNCDEARIKIHLPDVPEGVMTEALAASPLPQPALSLTKTYLGEDGFIKLVNDFKAGAKSFALEEFKSSYAPAQWKELQEGIKAHNVRSVRVSLEIKLSDEMDLYLSAANGGISIPRRLIN